jgi:hypothetical protein
MLDPAVSQATIASTICASGYASSIRPSVTRTEELKRAQVPAYGYGDCRLSDYAEDHVIALELGGAPSAPANPWPEPRSASYADDHLEDDLHARVCSKIVSLGAAQAQLLAAKTAHGYRRSASLTS